MARAILRAALYRVAVIGGATMLCLWDDEMFRWMGFPERPFGVADKMDWIVKPVEFATGWTDDEPPPWGASVFRVFYLLVFVVGRAGLGREWWRYWMSPTGRLVILDYPAPSASSVVLLVRSAG